MEWTSIIVAVITALGAFAGVYSANKKQTALISYRLEQLEHKVDKHNGFDSRITKIETQIADMQRGGVA